MSNRVNQGTSQPYDKTDLESILRHAAKLKGKTLHDVLGDDYSIIGDKNTKGIYGQVIERDYFLIDNNNEPVPDFKEVGVELKVTPIVKNDDGQLVSKERLVLGIINYNDVPIKGFRMFTDKNSHLLIIFYFWIKGCNIYDYKILKVVDWKPSPTELRVIKEDWDIIEGYVKRGEAHLLSEKYTKYLAANRKGVGHGKDLREQPFSDILAKQRALSFKSSFMTTLFRTQPDINAVLVDRTNSDDAYGSLFNDEWEEGVTFEKFVLSRYDKFIGMTCAEIEGVLGIYLDDRGKQYYNTLAMAMVGVIGKKHIKEFEEANIKMKTIRLRSNGNSKESMSFRAFKYDELVEQTWETSDFYEELDRSFFFPVFQFNERDTSKESRKDLRFIGAFFWTIPEDDLVTVSKVWEDTKEKILAERFNDFIKSSDGMISHVRPHARDGSDTYTYNGKEYVKKSFWFNDSYLNKIVHENLDIESDFRPIQKKIDEL